MKKIILSTAAIAVFASSASAVESGKIYVRGDLGYGAAIVDAQASSAIGGVRSSGFFKNARPSGFTGSIGLGYNFSDSIRTDLTVNVAKFKKKHSPFNLEVKSNYISAMASVYYDINNSSDFTPYVMGGLGFAQKDIDFQKTMPDEQKNASFAVKSTKSNTFAYQLGAGVAYKLTQDLYLDLGYKITGFGTQKVEFKNASQNITSASGKTKFINSLTTGLRFNF